MYRVFFKVNNKYHVFDFSDESEALKFFNFSRKLKERTDVTYIIL
jgi:hypothetical protein